MKPPQLIGKYGRCLTLVVFGGQIPTNVTVGTMGELVLYQNISENQSSKHRCCRKEGSFSAIKDPEKDEHLQFGWIEIQTKDTHHFFYAILT